MLLVAEFLFAIWFYKSENSLERIVAGSIMALVLVSLMLLVMRMYDLQTNNKPSHVSSRTNFKVNVVSFWGNIILYHFEW